MTTPGPGTPASVTVVHRAGVVQEHGSQWCAVCGVLLAEPGLMPFKEGAKVAVTNHGNGAFIEKVLTKRSVTCSTRSVSLRRESFDGN